MFVGFFKSVLKSADEEVLFSGVKEAQDFFEQGKNFLISYLGFGWPGTLSNIKEFNRQSLMGQVHPETKHRWNQPRKRVLMVQALLVQSRRAAGVYLFPSKLRDELYRLRAVLFISPTAFTQHHRVRPSLPPFLPYLHILYSFVIYLTFKFFLCVSRLCSSSVSFLKLPQISKIFPIYLMKKSPCISGPTQFKPVLFKSQLYNNIYYLHNTLCYYILLI